MIRTFESYVEILYKIGILTHQNLIFLGITFLPFIFENLLWQIKLEDYFVALLENLNFTFSNGKSSPIITYG